jgi:hypothetical protein
MEKKIEEIKIHCTESQKRDFQDAAMEDDRRVSDWIVHTLIKDIKLRKAGFIMTEHQCNTRGE